MTDRRRSLAALVGLAAALTLLHLAVNGYSFGGSSGRPSSPSSDHANILPWVYWYQDPSLFPHDAAIRMNASYATVLWRIAAWLSGALSVEGTFFLLHVLSIAGAYAGILFLARSAGAGGAAGLLAGLFFVIARHGPAGVDTHDPALYTRTAALPLALWGLGAILARRSWTGAILLGAAYCVHPLTAFYVGAIAVPLWLLSTDRPWSERIGGPALFAAIAAVASALLGGDAAGRLGPPSAAWLQLQVGNNSMHLFPWTWGESVWRDLLLSVLLLMPALLGPSPRAARRLASAAAIGAAGLLALGWTTTAWMPSMLFMQVQPLRGLQMTVLVGLVLGAWWIADRLERFPSLAARPSAVAGTSSVPDGRGAPAGVDASSGTERTRGDEVRRTSSGGPPSRRAGPARARDLKEGPIRAGQSKGPGGPGGLDARGGARIAPWRLSERTLTLAAGAIVVLGLLAHADLVAVAGVALLGTREVQARLRIPLVLSSVALLLIWIVRDGGSVFTRMAPDALRSFGAPGALVWCAALVLVPLVLALVDGPRRMTALRTGVLVLGAVALLSTTLTRGRNGAWRYRPEADYPVRDRSNPWVDVQRWVASHTPADAFVLNPPYLEGFRTYSRRSQFVDWKQGTLSMFNEPFGQEWLQRLQAIVRRPLDPANAWRNVVLNYESLPPQELEALFRTYGLTHMVTESASKDRPLPWREIYSNGVFRVLETGLPPGSAAAPARISAPPPAPAR